MDHELTEKEKKHFSIEMIFNTAMDKMKRAAQFSPFAALTGYENTVESARDQFVKDLELFGEHMENIDD